MIKYAKHIDTKTTTQCQTYKVMNAQAKSYHGKSAHIMNTKSISNQRSEMVDFLRKQNKNAMHRITTCAKMTYVKSI